MLKNINQYNEIDISKSYYMSEIEGIIFGGMSSRFWMLRKHINSMKLVDIEKKSPFFSW
jgi:hypothetical protein